MLIDNQNLHRRPKDLADAVGMFLEATNGAADEEELYWLQHQLEHDQHGHDYATCDHRDSDARCWCVEGDKWHVKSGHDRAV